jgi:hypothetical protein
MPSNPSLQACRETVAPSSSVCSLRTIPAGFRANSLASFALRALRGWASGPRPVELQKVEGVQDRLAGLVTAMQGLEDGDTVGTDHHGLAVDRERPGAQLARRRGDGGIAIGPIMTAAREEAHNRAVPAHDQPIAVVLDLVHPDGTRT